MFYVPPHVVLEPGSHHTEECYAILRGHGTMMLAGKQVDVRAGMFIHLPPWCEHGIENTGEEAMRFSSVLRRQILNPVCAGRNRHSELCESLPVALAQVLGFPRPNAERGWGFFRRAHKFSP